MTATPAVPNSLLDVILPGATVEDFAEIMENVMKNGKTIGELKGFNKKEMEAVYNVAYSTYNSGDYAKAHQIFQFLCQFYHIEKKYWMGLGSCRQMLKRYVDAIDAYSYAMLLDVNDPRPPLQAADCHIALGDKTKAISALTAAIEWSSDQPKYQTVKQRAQALLQILEQHGDGMDSGATEEKRP